MRFPPNRDGQSLAELAAQLPSQLASLAWFIFSDPTPWKIRPIRRVIYGIGEANSGLAWKANSGEWKTNSGVVGQCEASGGIHCSLSGREIGAAVGKMSTWLPCCRIYIHTAFRFPISEIYGSAINVCGLNQHIYNIMAISSWNLRWNYINSRLHR